MLTRLTPTMHLLSGLTLSLLAACGGADDGADSADSMRADQAVQKADGTANGSAAASADNAANEDPGCPVELICRLCDDGSCATPNVEMIDGKCGPVTFTCETDAPGNIPPTPANPPPTSTPPSAPVPPAEGCPVPTICQVCDDGSCAIAKATIVNGQCGPVVYSCVSDEGGTPGSDDGSAGSGSGGTGSSGATGSGGSTSGGASPTPSEGCPVPAICQLCDDGSCATPIVEMLNGSCGPITYSCEPITVIPPTSSAGDPGSAGATTGSAGAAGTSGSASSTTSSSPATTTRGNVSSKPAE